jgi:hypothetical protein
VKNFEKKLDDDRSISIVESNVILKNNNKETILNLREIKAIKIEKVKVFSFKMLIFNSIFFLVIFFYVNDNCLNPPSNFELFFFLVILLLTFFYVRESKYQILITDINLKYFKYKIYKKEMNDVQFFITLIKRNICKQINFLF